MNYDKQKEYLIKILEEIVNIPSPSGFTGTIMHFLSTKAEEFGYKTELLATGSLVVTVPGRTKDVLGVGAHVDTLGAMVRSVTSSGTLKFFPVGGYMMSTIEGEYCKIHSRRTGKTFSGTVLTTKPSVHVHDGCRDQKREPANMEIRLDECVESSEDVKALGIDTGDYISFNPRFVYTSSGYIKSRHLDDKASVAVLMTLLKYIYETKQQPKQTLKMIFTNYEELGHGASYMPEDIHEFLAVDMGALGDDLTGDETKVSICAMDATGPYDYEMTNTLIKLADELEVDYAVDIFPHYGSDASSALKAGANIRAALVGQGVHASHSMERTHEKGLMNTLELVKGYVGIK